MQSSIADRRHWTSRQPLAARRSGTSLAVEMSPLSIRYRAKNLVDEPSERRRSRRLARALNVLVASLGLVVTAPLMLLIALAIKLTSPGPVLFRQHRVGIDRRRSYGQPEGDHRRAIDRGGKIFTIYKFRTMAHGHESGAVWASRDDPRVTPVGRILRATRLDELPQFVNVLKGDMNIVGPRPEQPEIFSELKNELGPRYRTRQRVLPGITGLAQVQQGYDTDLESVREKVRLDLEYINGRSPATDLQIMARTVPVMLFRKVWM